MNLDQHHRPHVTPREALVSRERIAPNQWELRPLRRRSRMKAGPISGHTSWPTSPYMPGAHTAVCGRDINTKQCHIKLPEADTRYAENVPARRLFPFLPLVCVSTPAALKANIHPRRHPFRCAQFSARWFSRGQGIHLRPYCRMANILTQSVRIAAAENHIVFGSR